MTKISNRKKNRIPEVSVDQDNLQKGNDAKLIWYVDLNIESKPIITDTGRADFKNLIRQIPIRKDQEIVSLVPPSERICGTIDADGKDNRQALDKSLPEIKNTYTSEDNLTLLSKIDGYLFNLAGELVIEDFYHIKGNVNFNTGNINFDGAIIIEGDVLSGFRVEATDNIYIKGNVEASEIFSHNGDISVQCGIIGKGRAKILTGGSLFCGYIQDASVHVKEDVVVDHYAINSNIICEKKVLLEQNEGLIRGGKTQAGSEIKAIEIGTKRNIPTEVVVSKPVVDDISLQKIEIRKKIELINSRFTILGKKIEFLNLLKEGQLSFSEDKKEKLSNLISESNDLKKTIDLLKTKAQQIDIQNTKNPDSSITVFGTLHKAVQISIGQYQLKAEKIYKNVSVYCEDEQIRINSGREIDNEF